ncbi:MAG: sialidase, partial [Verrucomicrobia bacterium]
MNFARNPFEARCILASVFLCAISVYGADAPYNSASISGLGARNIGSAAMSGRISAIAGVREPSGKITLYVGSASGGVWKSDDSGTRYRPVFDEQSVQSIGAIALDPKNSKNVWVGTGESWTRNSVSIGDGMYKSTDGGETWSRAGLEKSERVARIAIDPRNSDTVFVAVPGALWSDSPDRGLYKTTDGGKRWQQVLKGANLSTGCTDIKIDPDNPDIMLAAMWDFRRKGWEYRSGGDSPTAPSASGLFRSTDGGNTWTEITSDGNKGFPKKPYGRLAVAIAPSNSKRVYAFVESPDSALFVSDDGGATWEKRDKSQWMVWRPFYFANLVVDPKNPDRLFKPDGTLIVSDDGGKSFAEVGGFQGAHGDAHDVWIDATNPQVVFVGDDGGMWYSYNGGSKWWKAENLPVSQFYHVSIDNDDPYHVYGGLQDNSSWVGDSQYPGGITNHRWENMFNGDGFWMFQDPADPDYIYAEYQGGEIGRVNHYTHQARNIKPRPNYNEKLRFNWNTPIALSPNEKGTIYIGAQFLFRSRDHGQTWDRISPDLTTNDPQKQKQEQSGGVTVDNSSAEMHTTIYSISES